MGNVLILIGLAGLLVGALSLLRGHLRWAHIASRKTAGLAMAVAFVLIVVGGALLPPAHPAASQARPAAAALTIPSSSAAESTMTSSSRSMPSSTATPTTTALRPANVTSTAATSTAVGSTAGTSTIATRRAAIPVRLPSRTTAMPGQPQSAAAASSRVSASRSSAAAASSSSAAAAAAAESASVSASSAAASASRASAAAASSAASASASASHASAAAASRASAATVTSQPQPASNLCGAPANPYGYNYCGKGSEVDDPPADICTYFSCIKNFHNGTGYMEECRDQTVSMSGGRRGACSSHGGELAEVTAQG